MYKTCSLPLPSLYPEEKWATNHIFLFSAPFIPKTLPLNTPCILCKDLFWVPSLLSLVMHLRWAQRALYIVYNSSALLQLRAGFPKHNLKSCTNVHMETQIWVHTLFSSDALVLVCYFVDYLNVPVWTSGAEVVGCFWETSAGHVCTGTVQCKI